MAEQEEPVYFDRNQDAVLGALLADLRIERQTVARAGYRENRGRAVQIDRRNRPELVAYVGRRYDVVYRPPMRTLSDVALSRSLTTWEYRSGRNAQIAGHAIEKLVEREPVE